MNLSKILLNISAGIFITTGVLIGMGQGLRASTQDHPLMNPDTVSYHKVISDMAYLDQRSFFREKDITNIIAFGKTVINRGYSEARCGSIDGDTLIEHLGSVINHTFNALEQGGVGPRKRNLLYLYYGKAQLNTVSMLKAVQRADSYAAVDPDSQRRTAAYDAFKEGFSAGRGTKLCGLALAEGIFKYELGQNLTLSEDDEEGFKEKLQEALIYLNTCIDVAPYSSSRKKASTPPQTPGIKLPKFSEKNREEATNLRTIIQDMLDQTEQNNTAFAAHETSESNIESEDEDEIAPEDATASSAAIPLEAEESDDDSNDDRLVTVKEEPDDRASKKAEWNFFSIARLRELAEGPYKRSNEIAKLLREQFPELETLTRKNVEHACTKFKIFKTPVHSWSQEQKDLLKEELSIGKTHQQIANEINRRYLDQSWKCTARAVEFRIKTLGLEESSIWNLPGITERLQVLGEQWRLDTKMTHGSIAQTLSTKFAETLSTKFNETIKTGQVVKKMDLLGIKRRTQKIKEESKPEEGFPGKHKSSETKRNEAKRMKEE